jgi:ribonuclease P protein component
LLAGARRDASSSRCASLTSIQEHKTPPASLGFPRAARITRGAELQRIAREGKRIRTTFVEVRIIASPLPSTAGLDEPVTRVGLIVPRLGNTAVARNRLKRSLREVVRQSILPAGLRANIVFRVRASAYTASFHQIAADIEQRLDELKAKSIASLVSESKAMDVGQSL